MEGQQENYQSSIPLSRLSRPQNQDRLDRIEKTKKIRARVDAKFAFWEKNKPIEPGYDYEIYGQLRDHYKDVILLSRGIGEKKDQRSEDVVNYIHELDNEAEIIMNNWLMYHDYQASMKRRGIPDAPKPNFDFPKSEVIQDLRKAVERVNVDYAEKLKNAGVKPVSAQRVIDIINQYGTFFVSDFDRVQLGEDLRPGEAPPQSFKEFERDFLKSRLKPLKVKVKPAVEPVKPTVKPTVDRSEWLEPGYVEWLKANRYLPENTKIGPPHPRNETRLVSWSEDAGDLDDKHGKIMGTNAGTREGNLHDRYLESRQRVANQDYAEFLRVMSKMPPGKSEYTHDVFSGIVGKDNARMEMLMQRVIDGQEDFRGAISFASGTPMGPVKSSFILVTRGDKPVNMPSPPASEPAPKPRKARDPEGEALEHKYNVLRSMKNSVPDEFAERGFTDDDIAEAKQAWDQHKASKQKSKDKGKTMERTENKRPEIKMKTVASYDYERTIKLPTYHWLGASKIQDTDITPYSHKVIAFSDGTYRIMGGAYDREKWETAPLKSLKTAMKHFNDLVKENTSLGSTYDQTGVKLDPEAKPFFDAANDKTSPAYPVRMVREIDAEINRYQEEIEKFKDNPLQEKRIIAWKGEIEKLNNLKKTKYGSVQVTPVEAPINRTLAPDQPGYKEAMERPNTWAEDQKKKASKDADPELAATQKADRAAAKLAELRKEAEAATAPEEKKKLQTKIRGKERDIEKAHEEARKIKASRDLKPIIDRFKQLSDKSKPTIERNIKLLEGMAKSKIAQTDDVVATQINEAIAAEKARLALNIEESVTGHYESEYSMARGHQGDAVNPVTDPHARAVQETEKILKQSEAENGLVSHSQEAIKEAKQLMREHNKLRGQLKAKIAELETVVASIDTTGIDSDRFKGSSPGYDWSLDRVKQKAAEAKQSLESAKKRLASGKIVKYKWYSPMMGGEAEDTVLDLTGGDLSIEKSIKSNVNEVKGLVKDLLKLQEDAPARLKDERVALIKSVESLEKKQARDSYAESMLKQNRARLETVDKQLAAMGVKAALPGPAKIEAGEKTMDVKTKNLTDKRESQFRDEIKKITGQQAREEHADGFYSNVEKQNAVRRGTMPAKILREASQPLAEEAYYSGKARELEDLAAQIAGHTNVKENNALLRDVKAMQHEMEGKAKAIKATDAFKKAAKFATDLFEEAGRDKSRGEGDLPLLTADLIMRMAWGQSKFADFAEKRQRLNREADEALKDLPGLRRLEQRGSDAKGREIDLTREELNVIDKAIEAADKAKTRYIEAMRNADTDAAKAAVDDLRDTVKAGQKFADQVITAHIEKAGSKGMQNKLVELGNERNSLTDEINKLEIQLKGLPRNATKKAQALESRISSNKARLKSVHAAHDAALIDRAQMRAKELGGAAAATALELTKLDHELTAAQRLINEMQGLMDPSKIQEIDKARSVERSLRERIGNARFKIDQMYEEADAKRARPLSRPQSPERLKQIANKKQDRAKERTKQSLELAAELDTIKELDRDIEDISKTLKGGGGSLSEAMAAAKLKGLYILKENAERAVKKAREAGIDPSGVAGKLEQGIAIEMRHATDRNSARYNAVQKLARNAAYYDQPGDLTDYDRSRAKAAVARIERLQKTGVLSEIGESGSALMVLHSIQEAKTAKDLVASLKEGLAFERSAKAKVLGSVAGKVNSLEREVKTRGHDVGKPGAVDARSVAIIAAQRDAWSEYAKQLRQGKIPEMPDLDSIAKRVDRRIDGVVKSQEFLLSQDDAELNNRREAIIKGSPGALTKSELFGLEAKRNARARYVAGLKAGTATEADEPKYSEVMELAWKEFALKGPGKERGAKGRVEGLKGSEVAKLPKKDLQGDFIIEDNRTGATVEGRRFKSMDAVSEALSDMIAEDPDLNLDNFTVKSMTAVTKGMQLDLKKAAKAPYGGKPGELEFIVTGFDVSSKKNTGYYIDKKTKVPIEVEGKLGQLRDASQLKTEGIAVLNVKNDRYARISLASLNKAQSERINKDKEDAIGARMQALRTEIAAKAKAILDRADPLLKDPDASSSDVREYGRLTKFVKGYYDMGKKNDSRVVSDSLETLENINKKFDVFEKNIAENKPIASIPKARLARPQSPERLKTLKEKRDARAMHPKPGEITKDSRGDQYTAGGKLVFIDKEGVAHEYQNARVHAEKRKDGGMVVNIENQKTIALSAPADDGRTSVAPWLLSERVRGDFEVKDGVTIVRETPIPAIPRARLARPQTPERLKALKEKKLNAAVNAAFPQKNSATVPVLSMPGFSAVVKPGTVSAFDKPSEEAPKKRVEITRKDGRKVAFMARPRPKKEKVELKPASIILTAPGLAVEVKPSGPVRPGYFKPTFTKKTSLIQVRKVPMPPRQAGGIAKRAGLIDPTNPADLAAKAKLDESKAGIRSALQGIKQAKQPSKKGTGSKGKTGSKYSKPGTSKGASASNAPPKR